MTRLARLFLLLAATTGTTAEMNFSEPPERPINIIFDTDMGNDVDDALALGVIHALQSRGECDLLAVTLTKDHPLSAPFIDLVNTFYGRGGIPVGVVKDGKTPQESKFTVLAETRDDGKLRYPHDIESGSEAEDATTILRQALAGAADASVVLIQVGFSTNLARLLDSPADNVSPLMGKELVAKKVKLLSIMAGAFAPIDGGEHLEYNVVEDIPAAQKLVKEWPTPIVFSGFEIGLAIPYPAASIERDFAYVEHHPLQEAYQLYLPTPHERPTWDLTSVLWAVRPERGYFGLSPAGRVSIDERGATTFADDPQGRHFFLTASPDQEVRVKEALTLLASEPPQKQ